jgi:crotonobetainyl-CoA:carnitine CoA-transferase CaiB-like acyl-CoA transferase
MESMLNMFVYEFQEAQFHVDRPRVVYKPLRARDGFVMTVSVTPANFYAMCDAVGHPEWKTDPRFVTPALRNQHADEFRMMVEEWTSVRTAQECETLLNEAGVPCSRYRELKDVIADPAMRDRGAFATVRDDAGEFLVPNLPYRLMHDGASVRGRVPSLGEHTYEVLASMAGLSKSAIDALAPQTPSDR